MNLCIYIMQFMQYFPGFLAPSGGTANVNGFDIRSDMSKVRGSLGMCPQHDVLFDTLTVEEHLYFYGRVRISHKIIDFI